MVELCAAAGLLPAAAFAQMQPAWLRAYDTPANDFASAIVIDAQSNICVAGSAAGDFVTIKYAPDGTRLWAERFGDSRQETATAIAADGAGQVWIAGVTADSGLLTLKYDANGALLWSRRLEDSHVFGSPLVRLAVDPSGNAFLAAGVRGEHIAVKYSPEGDELWVRHYSVPDHFVNMSGAAVDAAGNLVAAGATIAAGGVSSFLTLKYNPSGNLLWAASDDWNGDNNFTTGVALDSHGNVCVTGSSHLGRHQLVTAKYSASFGQLLWMAARPPGHGYNAVARALKVDSEDNIIITGDERWPVSEDEDEFEIVTVKYDPAGTELWSARSTFQRTPEALALDTAGNIYVGGCADCDMQRKLLFLKYAPTGSQLSETIFPSTASVIPRAVVVSQSGDIYMNGENFAGDSGWAIETRKFFQSENSSQVTAAILPASARASAGSNVTFSVVVSGLGPFTYQWRRFGYTLVGETNATLTITNVQWSNQSDYTVAVSNAVSYTISPEARLTFVPTIKSITCTADGVVLVWDSPMTFGLKLQSATSLDNPEWTDVLVPLGRTEIEVLRVSTGQYFRLVSRSP